GGVLVIGIGVWTGMHDNLCILMPLVALLYRPEHGVEPIPHPVPMGPIGPLVCRTVHLDRILGGTAPGCEPEPFWDISQNPQWPERNRLQSLYPRLRGTSLQQHHPLGRIDFIFVPFLWPKGP